MNALGKQIDPGKGCILRFETRGIQHMTLLGCRRYLSPAEIVSLLPQIACETNADLALRHRLDALRFRFHPCFQLPTDQALTGDASVQMWTVDNGAVLITAATGIAWIELYPEGDQECHHWIEYIDPSSGPAGAPRQVSLTENALREHLPEKKRKKKLRIKVFSCGGADAEVEDFASLTSKEGKLKLPDGRPGFKSSKLGFSKMENSQPAELILGVCLKQPKFLRSIRVFHGRALNGLEFFYEDGFSEFFGNRGGKPSDFPLETKRAETLLGFYIRAGLWIDGIQILTSTGRRSQIFGNATGGSG